jgi:hypothetical protein
MIVESVGLVHCLTNPAVLLIKVTCPCAKADAASAEIANIPSSFFIGLFRYVVGMCLKAA